MYSGKSMKKVADGRLKYCCNFEKITGGHVAAPGFNV